MKIIVLSGSPKAETSATLQYVRFIQKNFPEHDLQIVRVVHEHEQVLDDNDTSTFDKILDDVRAADGVLWAFPIYTYLVHAHFKRFIELVEARTAQDAFRGKYTAALSTSTHFFDHTSHNYLHAICDDWGMKYVGAFSAAVYDLLKKEGKQHVISFARGFFEAIESRMPTVPAFDPVTFHDFEYSPAPADRKASLGGKRMVILTDSEGDGTNVARMVERFRGCLGGAPEAINLHQVSIQTACTGCFRCGADGVCIYRDLDDLHDLYMSDIAQADMIVMAGSIKDRYLSSRWKVFFDRGFFRPVIPWFPGKQLAFIVSGPLKQIPNLRQIIEGYADFHQANLVGIVTDESEDSQQIDELLDGLAQRTIFFAEQDYVQPRTFLGVGSTKIFRDETWGMLRPVFQEAYRYYRKAGMYDFPHHSFRTRAIAIGGMLMTKIPGVRQKFFKALEAHMVKCLQDVAEKGE